MKTIYKYVLKPEGIQMPVGANILTVAKQRNAFCVWAEVDTEAENELVRFEIFGTGDKIANNNYEFVSTVFTDAYKYVFHIYKQIIR